MQLYYIRHGQSANNALYATQGDERERSHDPELTALGVTQAERLAARLAERHPEVVPGQTTDAWDNQNRAGFELTHLYTSLMVRAVSTGTILASRLGLPLHAWVDVHEEGGIHLADPDTGEERGLPGMGRAYFTQHHPALVLPETLGDAGWWTGTLEPVEARSERARRVAAELLARHGDTNDRVGLVSHAGFYNHLLAALLGFDRACLPRNLLNNCSLSRLDYTQRGWAVIYQNRADHLPAELITV